MAPGIKAGISTFGLSIAITLVFAGGASATTFCVPGFHAACPNNGTNVAQPNLETAMRSNAVDGIPDRVLIDEHTYTDANAAPGEGTLEPAGTDPLEVVGAGTDRTFITSAGTLNQFVVNLDAAGRSTDMKDLTIIVPASFPDGLGAGIQADNSNFERVNIESRNPGSDAAPSLIGDVSWKDSRIYGALGGSVDTALSANTSNPSNLVAEKMLIENPSWGVRVEGNSNLTTLDGVRITEPVAYGIRVSGGGELRMDNSVIETGGQEGISVSTTAFPGETDIAVAVRNSTFVNSADPADPAIRVSIAAALNSRSAEVTVTESIFEGFQNTWEMVTPAGPGIGTASLTFIRSNFKPQGLPVDSPVVDTSDPGNTDLDPQFTAADDYRLKPGSPLIDAGGE